MPRRHRENYGFQLANEKRLGFLRELRERLTRRARELSRDARRVSDRVRSGLRRDVSSFRERIMERTSYTFRFEKRLIHDEVYIDRVINLPPYQTGIQNQLREAYEATRDKNKVAMERLTEYIKSRFISRFRKRPCGSSKYYYNTTIVNLQYTDPIEHTAYLRVALFMEDFRNSMLRESLPFPFPLRVKRTKSTREIYVTETRIGETQMNTTDQLTVTYNLAFQPKARFTLGFILRHPKFILKQFTRMLGMHESSSNIEPCSMYIAPSYRSKRKHYDGLELQRLLDLYYKKKYRSYRGIM